MTHNWLRCLVPREWSADEALLAAKLLRKALDAVWGVHGEAMADALGEDRYRDRMEDYFEPEDLGDLGPGDFDDIPY